MHEHHITDMANRVAEAFGLDQAGRDKAREAIAACWEDKIALTWTIEDVRDCKKGITDEEAKDALAEVLHGHDASVGVTWDTLVAACGGSYPSGDDDEDDA